MKLIKVKLNDICNLITCGVAKRPNYVESGIPFLSARNVKNQKIIWNNFKFISQKSHDELTKYNKPLKGDILYTRVGSYGEAAIVDEDREFSIFVSLTLIKPNHEIVNNKFLVYFLNSPIGKLLAQNNVTSSGVGNLNVSKVRNFELFLPSLTEQQRIVAKLDSAFAEIDKMISLKKKSILNLDKFYFNQLNSLFLDNSNNWENTTLGTYYDVRDGTHDSPKYVSQGIPLVTSKNLKNGMIDLTKIKYIKNEDYLLIKKRSGVSIGDVLMAMIGTIGNPVIIKNDNEFAIKNVALFKIKKNQSSDFLKYYLDSAFVKNKMMKDSKGTTQQFVGLGYLRNFPIKVPSFEKQQVISKKIMSLEKNIDDLKNKYNLILKNYISLKNSLLTELLSKSKAA